MSVDTKTVGLAHFDGCNTREGITDLFNRMEVRVRANIASDSEVTTPIFQYVTILCHGFHWSIKPCLYAYLIFAAMMFICLVGLKMIKALQ